MTTIPETHPALRYHRLARTAPGWWRPLATLLLALLAYVGLFLLLVPGAVLVGMSDPRLERAMDQALNTETLDTNQPVTLALMLLSLAIAVPACRWAARMTGRRGGLDSVEGRFRWGLFSRAVLPVVAVVTAFAGLTLLVDPRPIRLTENAGWLALAVVLVVPLQAAGEEYVFRGLLPQVVGRWLRSPIWGVLLSIPLFVAGHEYNVWGLAGTAAFALGATYLVWRTGGLEVAIAWHAVNNLFAFACQALGLIDPAAPITPVAALTDLAMTVAVVGVLEWLWRTRWSGHHVAVRPASPQTAPIC